MPNDAENTQQMNQTVQANPDVVVQMLRQQLSHAMMESAINMAALQGALQENAILRNRITELETGAS